MASVKLLDQEGPDEIDQNLQVKMADGRLNFVSQLVGHENDGQLDGQIGEEEESGVIQEVIEDI